jgi:deoxyadenosine/deoxycytidine kinase
MKIKSLNKDKKNPLFISIEGNIGSGKSTFLKKIFTDIKCPILPEPTDKWQNTSGANILEAFYKDTKRWAYSFQSYAFLTRIQSLEKMIHLEETINYGYFLSERYVFADRYVFAKTCFDLGLINQLEWNIYLEWYSWMMNKDIPIPSGFIYLKTSPEKAFERINERRRSEETGITIDYINLIHNNHEKWLIHKKELDTKFIEIPILIIDCDEDFEHNNKQWNILLEKTEKFIDKCSVFSMKEGINRNGTYRNCC